MMRRCRTRRFAAARSGLSILYAVVILVALVAFVSLAIDIGRIRLARAELQTAADAAARSGADSLPISSNATIDGASDAATSNGVIDADDHHGQRIDPGVQLRPDDDIEMGIWDPAHRTFSAIDDDPGTSNDERRRANAVHVIGRRIAERDSSVPLIFAPVIGVFQTDIERQATAYITGGPDKFGFVGLDYVRASGNLASVDSVSLPSKTRRTNGWLASNGDIDLGNADVYGDARPGISGHIDQQPNSHITGWQANLDAPLSYPADKYTPPATNDNSLLPSGTLKKGSDFVSKGNATILSGKYVLTSFTVSGNDNVTINAPADFYINGDFKMTGGGTLKINSTGSNVVRFFVNGNFDASGGNVVNTSSNPSALYVSVTKANSSVKVSGNLDIYAHIYAPLSSVTITGGPSYYGWIIGKNLEFKGTSQLHYDESRDNHAHYKIQLVK